MRRRLQLARSHFRFRRQPAGASRDRDKISSTIPSGEQETAASKLTPEQSRDVEAKLANIIRKYGERLSEEQRKHLRKILAYNETMLAPIGHSRCRMATARDCVETFQREK